MLFPNLLEIEPNVFAGVFRLWNSNNGALIALTQNNSNTICIEQWGGINYLMQTFKFLFTLLIWFYVLLIYEFFTFSFEKQLIVYIYKINENTLFLRLQYINDLKKTNSLNRNIVINIIILWSCSIFSNEYDWEKWQEQKFQQKPRKCVQR